MTSTYPRQDLPGHVATRGARAGARSPRARAAFGIASLSCAGGAVMGAVMVRLGLPVAGILVPAGGITATAFGVTSLARRERPRFLGIAGLVAGVLELLALLVLIVVVISILASWQG